MHPSMCYDVKHLLTTLEIKMENNQETNQETNITAMREWLDHLACALQLSYKEQEYLIGDEIRQVVLWGTDKEVEMAYLENR